MKTIKKAALLGVVAFMLSVLVLAPAVRAEGTENSPKGTEKKITAMEKKVGRLDDAFEKFQEEKDTPGRMAIMRDNGDFRVRGVVVNSVSASTSVLNVSYFGLSRDINVAGAKLIGGGKEIQLSDFKAGDKLSASGNYNESTHVITVKEIHNLSFVKNSRADEIQKRINELLKLIESLRAKLNASTN